MALPLLVQLLRLHHCEQYSHAQAHERDGRDHIILEVREGNVAARNLYDSLGFTQIGVRKRYYEDSREDAIVMILHLRSLPESDNA